GARVLHAPACAGATWVRQRVATRLAAPHRSASPPRAEGDAPCMANESGGRRKRGRAATILNGPCGTLRALTAQLQVHPALNMDGGKRGKAVLAGSRYDARGERSRVRKAHVPHVGG